MKNKNMMKKIGIWAIAIALPISSLAHVDKNRGANKVVQTNSASLLAACRPATGLSILETNNVRMQIMTAGDMWWDIFNTQNARYEIPKGSGIHSLFASAIWVGGLDAGANLKAAAMTYRQTGNDFWPGPLSTVDASVSSETCVKYDKHSRISRAEVEDFYNNKVLGITTDGYTVPASITDWPGNGDLSLGQDQYLAPYFDQDLDGQYNPEAGDYPYYDLDGSAGCSGVLYGDETLWWVYNDKGDVHTETGSLSIGLEIQAQAFAFKTNDDFNNMTFYKYKIINRSTETLYNTYFGQWVDSDLGNCEDDYVGCDVGRGLGYTYNADDIDDASNGTCSGAAAYGASPPAAGLDFFEGPIADASDFVDNDRDGIIDEAGEQIIMSKFVYYNNDGSSQGNPDVGQDFYNYLSGYWRDFVPFTYGGSSYNLGSTDTCDFMFPGDSDPLNIGTRGVTPPFPNWTESNTDGSGGSNTPADRRFVQSAGKFTLAPGAVNYITVGAVWARSTAGAAASVEALKIADDKAQALFDNCFKLLEGPAAPDLTIQELDKELVFTISNRTTSNNYLERYEELDPTISTIYSDTTYKFQGYQVFQLKDNTVSTTDLTNPDKARLVFQCDVKDGVTQLINFEFNSSINANVGTDMITKTAEDNGIRRSFNLTSDEFSSTSDKSLVNFKQYYYLAVAYAYNNYKTYNMFDATALDGQIKPYLAGRKNIGNDGKGTPYSAIPHKPNPESGGTIQNSSYGSGPKLTRIEGQGNGGVDLEITAESVSRILAQGIDSTSLQYENGRGPVEIKVVDPLNVPENEEFVFQMLDSITATTGAVNQTDKLKDAYWILRKKNASSKTDTVWSEQTIAVKSEQIINGTGKWIDTRFNTNTTYDIPKWGLSVSLVQVDPQNGSKDMKDQIISSSLAFSDPAKAWLSAVEDVDYSDNFDPTSQWQNWIRCGVDTGVSPPIPYPDYAGVDNNEYFEKILSGTWAPYFLSGNLDSAKGEIAQPRFNRNLSDYDGRYLFSVDVVFTSDKSKWTRCAVLEAQAYNANAEGNAKHMDLRKHASVDKNGNYATDNSVSTDPNSPNYISGDGMGWFPGYAINVETGERLNMAFAEDSGDPNNNGNDMIWNPTDSLMRGFPTAREPIFGGKHFIYIFGHNTEAKFGAADPKLPNGLKDIPRYDGGKAIYDLLHAAATAATPTAYFTYKREVYAHDIMWVNIPLLARGYSFDNPANIPTDAKVKIRVSRPFNRFYSSTATLRPNPDNNNHPMYTFGTADIGVKVNDNEEAKDALALINAVPNPYYAYSEYEKSKADNKVKFINLPEKCTISIYTMSGTLIRKIKKDDPTTYFDWDIKNTAGIPIASGLYIVHFDVPNVGERILKWFGVMRQVDLDTY